MSTDRLGRAASIAQIVGVVIAVLAVGASFLVPEVRQWVGLEEHVTDDPASPTDALRPSEIPLPTAETPQPRSTDTPVLATETPQPIDTPVPTSPPSSAGETWTRPADGMVMVHVPAGEFLMGSSDYDPDAYSNEKPQHTVYLDAFWIDRTEVTNAQYRRCVEAGACMKPYCWGDSDLNAPDQPAVCLSWYLAQDYAAWVGGRLPTEAEWEKAARGIDGRIYPWGHSPPDCDRSNFQGCTGKPLPAGSLADGASPYGALDMSGNAWEWVADGYDANYYAHSPSENPQASGSGIFRQRVLRGGAFNDGPVKARCAYRLRYGPNDFSRNIGFRVVVDPGSSGP